MTEYSISKDIKGAFKNAAPYLFVIPFLFYIIPTSCWLIHESAMFIMSAIDYSYTRALLAAALIELGIIFLTLIPVGDDERIKGLFRASLLCAALIVIIGSASKYAIQPYEEADNILATDKMKLSAMDSNIDSLEKALESVEGQPTNSAIASRALQSAISDRQKFISGLESDPNLAQSNSQKKYLAVMLRIALQFINLYILSALKKSIIKRISSLNAKNNKHEHERENPVVKKSLTNQVFENTEEISKPAQGGKKAIKPKNIEKMKASELVKYFHPNVKYEKVDDRHFIFSGNGRAELLAETGSPGSAWLQAAKTIRDEQGI